MSAIIIIVLTVSFAMYCNSLYNIQWVLGYTVFEITNHYRFLSCALVFISWLVLSIEVNFEHLSSSFLRYKALPNSGLRFYLIMELSTT